ncbi:MAG: Zn-ribbon domain-containing OB-fold protein [Proteobacteria bacterium]|nr:Zn-ribbon domain-containing OB-fold protein [Pseudomonadota bacterium]
MTEEMDYGVFEVDQHITAHSRYYAGWMGSHFYIRLRDEKKIHGVRCESCAKVFWPPRSTCGRCFSQLTADDLVEIGPEGTVETFTRVDYEEPVHPRRAPLIYAVITLDGADTGMAHFLGEVDFDRIEIGMRVRPVFAEERKGHILDIAYFKPV